MKFAGARTAKTASPVTTTSTAATAEGGAGFTYDSRSELFRLTSASFMGREEGFYESGAEKDSRAAALVKQIIIEPGGMNWLVRFVPFLRNELNMRTAAVMVAVDAVAEYGRLRRGGSLWGEPGPGHTPREIVSGAIGRADEFGEFIGYWKSVTGRRTLPGGVQRGLADAMAREVSEYTAMKYDGSRRPVRLGDAVQMIHPKPRSEDQSDLFGYLIRRRYQAAAPVPRSLDMVRRRRQVLGMDQAQRQELLSQPEALAEAIAAAGITHENLGSWAGRPLSGEEWEAMIPTMGYMALLRNLRNFDDAGVSDEAAAQVCAVISDPERVKRGKQFPFRFFSAYQAAQGSFRWADALSKALDLSAANIPTLGGRTLVLVDTSASMTQATLSSRSGITPATVGAVFAAMLMRRMDCDVVSFATGAEDLTASLRGKAALRVVDMINDKNGNVGHGTDVARGLQFLQPAHRRVVILSDEQDAGGLAGWSVYRWGRSEASVPRGIFVYSVNIGGGKVGLLDTKIPGRYALSGLSDTTFRFMQMAEVTGKGDWPF